MAYDIEDVKAIFARAEVVLDKDDVWTVQKTPVVKHQALERLAVALKINFSVPDVLRREVDEAVLLVVGEVEDGRTEWSIGEARVVPLVATGVTNQWGKPEFEAADGVLGNYQVKPKQPAYPYAMAEKRAKDRVILKLARLSGVYSEEDADEFKGGVATEPGPTRAAEAYLRAAFEIVDTCTDAKALADWWKLEADHRAKYLTEQQSADLRAAVSKKGKGLKASVPEEQELENVQS